MVKIGDKKKKFRCRRQPTNNHVEKADVKVCQMIFIIVWDVSWAIVYIYFSSFFVLPSAFSHRFNYFISTLFFYRFIVVLEPISMWGLIAGNWSIYHCVHTVESSLFRIQSTIKISKLEQFWIYANIYKIHIINKKN